MKQVQYQEPTCIRRHSRKLNRPTTWRPGFLRPDLTGVKQIANAQFTNIAKNRILYNH